MALVVPGDNKVAQVVMEKVLLDLLDWRMGSVVDVVPRNKVVVELADLTPTGGTGSRGNAGGPGTAGGAAVMTMEVDLP